MEEIMVLSTHTKFRLLDDSYIDRINSLGYIEILTNELRGHGILILNLNDNIVAAPLRSNMSTYRNGSSGFFSYNQYISSSGQPALKGIDISKMLFVEPTDIKEGSNYTFQDPKEEEFYQDNFDKYKRSVAKYINDYIKICNRIAEEKKVKWEILKEYQFTTLQNFHNKLGITITANDLQGEILKRNPRLIRANTD